MIIEAILGVVAVGAAASGWVYAYRARGESREALKAANDAAERARIAEAARDAAQSKASSAEAESAAAVAELRSTARSLTVCRVELESERRAKAELLEKLAKAGVPVGPTLIDSSFDRLHADKNRRGSEGRDPNSDSDEDRRSGQLSDDPPTDPLRRSGPR